MTMPWAIPLLTEKRAGDSPVWPASLSLDTPQIMGVLNVTPDSFSDGGQLLSKGELLHDRSGASVSDGYRWGCNP